MATIDIGRQQVSARIVYYGPGLSGKTTNLTNIHARLPEGSRGEMRSIATETERTLFFDLVPIKPIVLGGWDLRYVLYSVPGQEHYVRTRRAILGGVDGIVFVADADPERVEANRESLAELATHLQHYGRSIDAVPLVFQYNKTDLPTARPFTEMNANLNTADVPAFEAIATQGNGVSETLAAISRMVAQTL